MADQNSNRRTVDAGRIVQTNPRGRTIIEVRKRRTITGSRIPSQEEVQERLLREAEAARAAALAHGGPAKATSPGRPRMIATPNDPRCTNYLSGLLIGAAFDRHLALTGENIPALAEKVGISADVLRAYQRGHHTPTAGSRRKLEEAMGLEPEALVVPTERLTVESEDEPKTETGGSGGDNTDTTVTYGRDGDFLVITTVVRIPLTDI